MSDWHLRNVFIKVLGIAFLCVACINLFFPAWNFAADGLDFDSLGVAARAELRAYYVGTALTIFYICFFAEDFMALLCITIVLGAFASTRVIGYLIEGSDADDGFRRHQHGVFFCEVLGFCVALLFLKGETQETQRLFKQK